MDESSKKALKMTLAFSESGTVRLSRCLIELAIYVGNDWATSATSASAKITPRDHVDAECCFVARPLPKGIEGQEKQNIKLIQQTKATVAHVAHVEHLEDNTAEVSAEGAALC